MNEHFYNGFIKRAQDYGLSAVEADRLVKQADTSWLGRYLASGQVYPSVMANKLKILNELDPTGKLQTERVLLSSDELKKQRELAYDHMRNTLDRSYAGSASTNALLGAALLGTVGAVEGGMMGGGTGALAGLGIGGLGGAALGAGSHLYGRWRANKITDEDIARMKSEQKDRSFISDLVPFRNVLDATRAGGAKHDK